MFLIVSLMIVNCRKFDEIEVSILYLPGLKSIDALMPELTVLYTIFCLYFFVVSMKLIIEETLYCNVSDGLNLTESPFWSLIIP